MATHPPAVTHDQMRVVREQLLAATGQQEISQEMLGELRRYVNVYRKRPAATPPFHEPDGFSFATPRHR